eukprot:1610890-Ditylum_brightwellii.AAC.1
MARSAVAARDWFFGSSLARRRHSCTTPTGSASCGIADEAEFSSQFNGLGDDCQGFCNRRNLDLGSSA